MGSRPSLLDKTLLASWTLLYAGLIAGFGLMKRLEGTKRGEFMGNSGTDSRNIDPPKDPR
jgi:hypothetical protein